MGTTTTPPQTTTPPSATLPSGGGSLDSIIGRLEQLQRQKTAALEPQREQFQKQATADQAKIDKQFDELSTDKKALEQPPPAPPESDPLQGFASAAGILGMIASAFTKTPALAAMNAAAAAINAHNQGNEAEWEKQHQIWKEQTDLAYRRNELESQELQAALTKMTTDVTVGQAMIKQVAAKYDDPSLLLMNEAGLQFKAAEVQAARDRAAAEMMKARAEAGMVLGAGAGVSAGGTVHGTDFLKQLPEGIQTQVKALAEGRMAFPSGFALRSPYWQSMLQYVSQYDPSFDAVNYNARAKTRADFTSGKAAATVTSLNTVIGHMGRLSDAADKLSNTWSPTYNSIANFIISQKGDPRVQEFDTDKKAVVDELTRAFRGSAGAESDIQQWSQRVNAASSPAQLHGVIREMVGLLNSRIDALGDQYSRGMGTTSDGLDLLSPEAKKTWHRLVGGGENGPESDANTPPVPASLVGRQLQWSPTHHLFRDKQTGAIYDSNGDPVH